MDTELTYSIALELASKIMNDEGLANRQSLIEYIDSVLQRRLPNPPDTLNLIEKESGDEAVPSRNL